MIDDVRDAGRPVAAVERAIALMDVLADGDGPTRRQRARPALGATRARCRACSGRSQRPAWSSARAASGRYRLGLRAAHWGNAAVAGRDVRELARPLLAELAAI